jgi:hypothetical protein
VSHQLQESYRTRIESSDRREDAVVKMNDVSRRSLPNDCLDTRDNWKRAAMKQNISVGEFYKLVTVINVEAFPIPVNQPLFDLRKAV